MIPKQPPAGPGSSPTQSKRQVCERDNECVDDLVCEASRCIPWHRMSGPVPEVTKAELARMIDAGEVQVLDVRTHAEFKAGHVDGALNVPIGDLADEIDGIALDPAVPVVSVCLTAHRSIAATRLLRRHGYDAYQLQGGWIRVKKRDLPRAKGKAESP